MTDKQPILCYVDTPWAYFTTQQDLKDQWGDDWNDAPYESNAGEPYVYGDHDKAQGREPWEIVKVAWEGDFETPSDLQYNSSWSVDRINAGGVAWLQTSRWSIHNTITIPAGTTIEQFKKLIKEGGGKIYQES